MNKLVPCVGLVLALLATPAARVPAARTTPDSLKTPDEFLGFKVGTDRRLARWDAIVEYLSMVDAASDRVRVRDLGTSTNGNPFIAVEVTASSTLKNIDRFKRLQRKLYFQEGAPTDDERDEIVRDGKAVVVVTCNIHSTEIASSQMVLELVHRLATEQSPLVEKILDNVILVLVPSLNPDGQIMVTDWYNKNVGTEFEASPLPWLYHPYVGHDNNRDMYMFTQKESQLTAKLLWHDWFPSVWLDEHQQGPQGARIFVMPATDPINPNVHPLIYRWNGIFGQAQAAALEAAGKDGIIYNSTYTNFWQGAMAWSGWWHNQVGLLTEVASVRIATPTEQRRAEPGSRPQATGDDFRAQMRRQLEHPDEPLPAPRDTIARTEYPRPWLGGRWTLRDIVDYELIVTMALLQAAADQREILLRQIYEVNRETVEHGRKGDPAAILIPVVGQHDSREAAHLVSRLQMAGVEVYRAGAAFDAAGARHPEGTFVVPMAQVFARYAKDLLEKQTYPEVRRGPDSPPEPPYDVTAWSLGLLMGVETVFVKTPLADGVPLEKLDGPPSLPGTVAGRGSQFTFEYRGADTARAINLLLQAGARVSFVDERTNSRAGRRLSVAGISRARMEEMAATFGLSVSASDTNDPRASSGARALRAPRIGLYQSWTANMDEGWTRWVLEQYGFSSKTLHNADIKAGALRDRFDVVILPDQSTRDIVNGYDFATIRPEYRGGIGEDGIQSFKAFVTDGGTLVTLGAACNLAIERFPIPVRNLKEGLTRDQHFAPGAIVKIQVDRTHPVAYGMPAETTGFYNNSPFFALTEGFASQRVAVVARYPNANLVASGWLKGEDLMSGRAAVVVVETDPGRVVLFGLRPQHRAQTHATFPMLFNSLYLAASGPRPGA